MKKGKNLSIIIPSYNESESLRVLLKKVFRIFPSCEVYVIDDSDKIENKKTIKYVLRYERATLISRHKKSGRGSAVILGFKKALEKKNAKYFLEMDSDLAHDPEEIERFYTKLKEKDYDLIIGSRYLKDSRIVHITKERTVLSRIINNFLKLWLNINVTDFTSGFRLYSRNAVGLIVRSKISSRGFITLSETLYKINKGKLLIGEVPITWNYRVYGKSNVNNAELAKSLLFVIRLRLEDLLNNLKFW